MKRATKKASNVTARKTPAGSRVGITTAQTKSNEVRPDRFQQPADAIELVKKGGA